MGQTYGASVGLNQNPLEPGSGHIRISFAGAPENVDGMTERTLQEVKRLQEDAPPAALLATVKESARRQNELNLKDNGYWLARLQALHNLGKDPGEIITRNERIDALTPATVQSAFKKYFPLNRYVVVSLMPEK